MPEKKNKNIHRKLKHGAATLAIGTSLILPTAEVTAVKLVLDPPTQTVRQRVARIRDQLRQQTVVNSTEQDKTSPAVEEQWGQYPWPNWPNWRNYWPNWPNWHNW